MKDKNQQEKETKNDNIQISPTNEAIIAGQPLSFYLKAIIRPVLVSLGVLVIAEFTESILYLDWIVIICASSFISLALIRKKEIEAIHSLAAGAFSGVLIGLIISLFRFFIHFKVYLFFQIITLPIMFAVLSMLIAGSIFWLVKEKTKSTFTLSRKQ